MNFSSRLSLLIGKKGVSQRIIAAECDLSPAAVTQYTQGRTPKADELLRIAKYFGVTMEWMLTGETSSAQESFGLREEPATYGGSIQEWRDRARTAEAKVELLKSGMEGLLKKI
jgi:transcriptional regulator with XRE-family HTH domain